MNEWMNEVKILLGVVRWGTIYSANLWATRFVLGNLIGGTRLLILVLVWLSSLFFKALVDTPNKGEKIRNRFWQTKKHVRAQL